MEPDKHAIWVSKETKENFDKIKSEETLKNSDVLINKLIKKYKN